MSAATNVPASTWMHLGIVRGAQVEPILFNADAGPIALVAFAHGQLRMAASLLSVIVRLEGDEEFAALKCLIQPAINALELAGERLPVQAGSQGDGAGKAPTVTPRIHESALITAAATRAALADTHEVLLDSCAAAGSLAAVLRALEPFKLRLEKEAALLDGARLLVDGLCAELDAAHEAAFAVLRTDGGAA